MNDERFRKLFSEQITEEIKQLDELEKNALPHEFSDEFENKMQKLIKREAKAYYSIINTTFKKVLCSAAVIALVTVAYFPVKAACSSIYNYVVEKGNEPEKDETEDNTTVFSTTAITETTQAVTHTKIKTQECITDFNIDTPCTTDYLPTAEPHTETTTVTCTYTEQDYTTDTTITAKQEDTKKYEELIKDVRLNKYETRRYKTEYGTFEYQIDDGSVSISNYSQGASKAIIPDLIDGYPVTKIQSMAFCMCSSLEKIDFPDMLSEAGNDSLENTAWYKNQPDGPIYAGNVFYGYKGTVPENTTLEIREGTRTITGEALYEETGLVKVIIPDSVEHIGWYAFDSCENLSEIVFPSNTTVRVDEKAFGNTAWYNSQPDGEVYIGNVFYRYKGDAPENTNIVLRENTKSIAANAFMPSNYVSAAENFESFILNDGLEYIGNDAFANCTSISEIIIPDSVKEIGEYAFKDCESLSNVALPKNLEVISENMFESCLSLKYITIPESVKSIESGAFECTSLISVTLPENVTYIGNRAFGDDPELTDITIKNPDCVIYDGKGVFFGSQITEGNEIVDFIYSGRISGHRGSFAEAYAKKYGVKFNTLTN